MLENQGANDDWSALNFRVVPMDAIDSIFRLEYGSSWIGGCGEGGKWRPMFAVTTAVISRRSPLTCSSVRKVVGDVRGALLAEGGALVLLSNWFVKFRLMAGYGEVEGGGMVGGMGLGC